MNTNPDDMPKPPCPADATLYASLAPQLRAGTLPPREQAALRVHMRTCAPCRDEAKAAADQLIEDRVRRHYGVTAGADPFLTLDDIRRRVALDGPRDTASSREIQNTFGAFDTDNIDTIESRPGNGRYREADMAINEKQPQSSAENDWPGQSVRQPNRWRTAVGAASAVALIALFALLLRGFAAGKGTAATNNVVGKSATVNVQRTTPAATHGQWNTVEGMTYTTQQFTETPYPAFSPQNPALVYEVTLTPTTARRSDDGGKSWQALKLPTGSDQAIDIEIFASPLDVHTAFLTITANLGYGAGPSSCPSSARSASVGGATHGNIVASGVLPCSTTYRSTDQGQSWKAVSFPVNGTLAIPYSDSAPYAGKPLQGQGTRLYALLTCGPTCTSPGGRLVASADGGATWRVADSGGIGSGICDFAAQAGSQTVFAAVGNGACDVLNSPALSIYRSDNAGNYWVHISNLPQGGIQGMATATVGGKPLLIINLPSVNWQPHIISVAQNASEYRVSSDGGRTWVSAPLAGVPDKAQPVISQLIVRADGSLVVPFAGAADQGHGAKLYTWAPGEKSWRVLAPAPNGPVVTVLYTISSTGDETFWAVIRSSATQVGNTQAITYTVSSYQP